MASSNPRGKKKGRSFLYKAKKYGKKGLYGRGKNVEEETYNYFVRVMERLKDEFEDDEEKGKNMSTLSARLTYFFLFHRNIRYQRLRADCGQGNGLDVQSSNFQSN